MLKALELTGFKSFADRTRFEFHEGITVVVGPNGSGKSNVVDAMKWVLGSQSAKSLRGSEMTDVIFNGSGSRGALHSAEVTLVLDNVEGTYGGATMGNEVSITRRVYRSGEGEYLINGGGCRLRDIRELLAGTGIGTEAYSVIEQGKVDALLQASPRDRRAIFEEAAGISRFRGKRQEAARRLARVEQNLLRLSDIVDEVESRLRSVRMQAGKAQRYREGAKRLKELRTEIGIVDWFRLSDRLQSVADELDSFSGEESGRREWLEATEAELPKLEQALATELQTCQQVDTQLAKFREQVASIQATQRGLAERQRDIEGNQRRLADQWRATKQIKSDDGPDLAQLAAKLQAARSEYDDQTRALAETTEQARRIALKVERGEAQLAELKRRLVQADSTTQQSAETRRQLSQQHEQHQQSHKQLHAELEGLSAECDTLSQEQTAAESAHREAQQQAAEAERKLQAASQAHATLETELDSRRQSYQQASAELQSLTHRVELANELERENRDAQEVARRFVSEKLGLQPTAIADLLHVDVDSAPVIEAALGTLAEYLVVPSTTQLADLEGDLPAGAKLLRLDFAPQSSVVDQFDLSNQPGVWGRADGFVDSNPAHHALVRRLLGRTWIVDTLATAVRLAESVGPGLNFVTAEGDLLHADGTLVTGRRDSARSTLARSNQVEQLRVQAKQLVPQVQTLQDEVTRLETEFAEAKAQQASAAQQQRSTLAELSSRREALAAAKSRTEIQSQRQQQVADQLAVLESQMAHSLQQLQQVTGTSSAQTKQSDQLRATASEIENGLNADRETLAKISIAEKRYEVATAKLEQQIEVLSAAARETDSTGSNTEVRREIELQMAALEAKRSAIERERLAGSQQLAALAWQAERLTPIRLRSFAKRQQLTSQREAISQKLQSVRRQIDENQSRRSQLELAVAKLQHQRQSLVERLQDDYEIDLPQVAENYSSDRPKIDRKQAQAEIDELRNGLNRIGSVNVDALEELEEIESRYEAISAQYNDLSEAKASLEKLMAKLNVESRQMFLDTVETVRGHFQELFRRLFGGGDADLLLEEYDSEDSLDCGVEIKASPPGKDTRTISLLSGGEKTMTCVALLLAMFRSKPSPFCVLDEVDAALDEANVGRFTGVLSDFLSSTQFIVITHSKKTMTGANTLYGVTMQESGISKQVSVKFDDVTEDGFIKPRASRGDQPPPLARAA